MHNFFTAIASILPVVGALQSSADRSSLPQKGPGQPQGGAGKPQGGRGQGGRPSMGQPQQGRPPAAVSLTEKLRLLSLPAIVSDADVTQIKFVVARVLTEINGFIKSSGQKVDNEALKLGMVVFRDWLSRQRCVSRLSTKYEIESTEKYPSQIFYTYPGTLAFEMLFKWAGNKTTPYRLLMFVSTVDLFTLGSLVENTTTGGVPVPKEWPKNPWSYWDERMTFWKKRS
jgi:hypothetical protein